MGNTQDSNGIEKDEEKGLGDVGGACQFKGKKNTSIRLKIQRMRKKKCDKKNSTISTSDQQQPATNNGHHISYLTTDEIRNLQVSF